MNLWNNHCYVYEVDLTICVSQVCNTNCNLIYPRWNWVYRTLNWAQTPINIVLCNGCNLGKGKLGITGTVNSKIAPKNVVEERSNTLCDQSQPQKSRLFICLKPQRFINKIQLNVSLTLHSTELICIKANSGFLVGPGQLCYPVWRTKSKAQLLQGRQSCFKLK